MNATIRPNDRFNAATDASGGRLDADPEWFGRLSAWAERGNGVVIAGRSLPAATLIELASAGSDSERQRIVSDALGPGADYADVLLFLDDLMVAMPAASGERVEVTEEAARSLGLLDLGSDRYGTGERATAREMPSTPARGDVAAPTTSTAVSPAVYLARSARLAELAPRLAALPPDLRSAVSAMVSDAAFRSLPVEAQRSMLTQTLALAEAGETDATRAACRMGPRLLEIRDVTTRNRTLAIFSHLPPEAQAAFASIVPLDTATIDSLFRLQNSDATRGTLAVRDLVPELVCELADPTRIDQGNLGSCAAASLEVCVARGNPAAYVSIIEHLVMDGEARTPGGGVLHFVPGSEHPRGDVTDDHGRAVHDGRTPVETIFQAALLNADGPYDPATDTRRGGSSGMSGQSTHEWMLHLLGRHDGVRGLAFAPSAPFPTAEIVSSPSGDGRALANLLLGPPPARGPVSLMVARDTSGSEGHALTYWGVTDDGMIIVHDSNLSADTPAADLFRRIHGPFSYPFSDAEAGTGTLPARIIDRDRGLIAFRPEDLGRMLTGMTGRI